MSRALSLVCLLVLAGCSDHEAVIAPTATTIQTQSPAATGTPTATPSPTSGALDYAVSGFKDGCITKADLATLPNRELIWDVTVKNAGDAGIKGFRKLLFHDDVASCNQTTNNGRPRITLFSGPSSYLPNKSGVTRFAAPADWDGELCGTNQYDIDI